MDFPKSIRLLEPFGGWGRHDLYRERGFNKLITLENDTGLCNRIFHWEVAYDINEKNDFDYRIIVLGSEWPETDLLDIPYTTSMQFNEHVMSHNYVYELEKIYFQHKINYEEENFEKIEKFSADDLIKMYGEQNFTLTKDDIIFDTGYQNLDQIYRRNNPKFHFHLPLFDETKRPLQNIKLKHQYIKDTIKDECKDLVGIHLRRFNGVKLSKKQLNTFPREIKEMYESIQHHKNIEGGALDFYEDSIYFDIIDKILEMNPNQRFYIATDLPEEFLKHYLDRYDTKVMTKGHLIDKFRKYLLNSNVDIVKLENYGNVLNNIVDLFCLSYTKFLISIPESSYSAFARSYLPKPYMDVDKGADSIINHYSEVFSNL